MDHPKTVKVDVEEYLQLRYEVDRLKKKKHMSVRLRESRGRKVDLLLPDLLVFFGELETFIKTPLPDTTLGDTLYDSLVKVMINKIRRFTQRINELEN